MKQTGTMTEKQGFIDKVTQKQKPEGWERASYSGSEIFPRQERTSAVW